MPNEAADAEFLQEMVEASLSVPEVDPEKLRADLAVCALEGLNPEQVFARALAEVERPPDWPPAPVYEAVAPR
jgi:hypothetical protein